MARVISGERSFVSIDTIYRERLDEILDEFGLSMLNENDRDFLNRAWHRLTPWPDSVPGLTRIKSKYMISPLSNGSVMLRDHGKTLRYSMGFHLQATCIAPLSEIPQSIKMLSGYQAWNRKKS